MSDEAVLTETEEQSVHTHGVHAEEPMGDEVGADRHRLRRKKKNTFQTHLHLRTNIFCYIDKTDMTLQLCRATNLLTSTASSSEWILQFSYLTLFRTCK